MSAVPPPDLTVVIMAYNEPETITPVVDEIAGTLDSLRQPWEIIIVDDGSSDGTRDAATRLAASRPGVRVVRHAENQGLGGVYRTGFTEARGEFVTFFPADGQFPASIIPDFRAHVQPVDMVLGLLPDRRGSPVGRLLSLCERILYRLLLGPMPAFQGILMFRRELLVRAPLKSAGRGWAVLMEFIIRVARSGARIVNRPTAVRPRSAGRSKVNNFRTILANLRQVVALRRILAG